MYLKYIRNFRNIKLLVEFIKIVPNDILYVQYTFHIAVIPLHKPTALNMNIQVNILKLSDFLVILYMAYKKFRGRLNS
jgi:hypothetical protein